jgi:hypothetical protein
MRPRLLPVICLALGMLLGCSCAEASAGTALVRPVTGRTVLAFGAMYGQRVHHGIDMRAAPGEAVSAAAAGTVTFAGRLPAEGGALGVTIETAEGLKVTCLPLSGTSVAAGDHVAAGAGIGTLAAAGDASYAETHLHLSVRHGETYLDPEPLLPAVAPAPPAVVPRPASSPHAATAHAAPRVAAAGSPSAVAPMAHGAAQHTAAGASPVSARARVPAPAAAEPVAVPAAALAPLAHTAAAALSARAAVPVARRAHADGGGSLLESATLAVRRLRMLATGLAGLLAALALMWPVWRRAGVAAAAAEPAPVRMRT